MSFNAKVYKVLIASPSDLIEERKLITDVINNWNVVNSEEYGIVLLPVKWETHSHPELGDRPQGLLNKQFVDSCDILIGAFWTRIGSPTGVAVSGTVEEIELLRSNGKLVMLYFSSLPVPPDKIDLKQLEALRAYKNSLYSQGLLETYGSLFDLEKKIKEHLTFVLRKLQHQNSSSVNSLSQIVKDYFEKWIDIKENSPSTKNIKEHLMQLRASISDSNNSIVNKLIILIKDADSFIVTDLESQRKLIKLIDAIYSGLNEISEKVG